MRCDLALGLFCTGLLQAAARVVFPVGINPTYTRTTVATPRRHSAHIHAHIMAMRCDLALALLCSGLRIMELKGRL